MDDLYAFVYKGVLTDISLDNAGRQRRVGLMYSDETAQIAKSVSLELLDPDMLSNGQRMSVVYTALHVFENMVRQFVQRLMAEQYGEQWWSEHVPEKIQKDVRNRIEVESRFRWHSQRGKSEIENCYFDDLYRIIDMNWAIFEPILANNEWTKQVLTILEKSRNVVMHAGHLDRSDVERIGINIRDWIRQAGG